ncbi:MAG: ATP-binding cassette domain-containing protein [Sphingomonadales bacterium]|nr:ATP-binding cassette domain-containing protein [Sphingomonadales bacterium]
MSLRFLDAFDPNFGTGFAYNEGEAPILDDISLHIPASAFVAIVGPSGAGKTTLFRVLMRLLAAQRGRVVVDGAPLSAGSMAGWRDRMGALPPAGRAVPRRGHRQSRSRLRNPHRRHDRGHGHYPRGHRAPAGAGRAGRHRRAPGQGQDRGLLPIRA